MTIESAKIKDEGNYKCIAEAPDYDAVSSSFSSVKVIGEFDQGIMNKNLFVYEHINLAITIDYLNLLIYSVQ